MRIIFCDSGFSHKEVDYMYREEYEAAKAAGFSVSLISFEALKKENVDLALKRVFNRFGEKVEAIYRGWMLRPEQYELLYNGLRHKNIHLINKVSEYRFCHYLPESYDTIRAFTPKSTFQKLTTEFNINNFEELLKPFENQSIIVKDYVKSQKHYWAEACFIPNANDLKQVEKVVKRFIELQDVDLNEGLVFREFVELEALTTHSKSGMPLTKEFRLFIKNGEIIQTFKYWDEGDYENVEPNIETFQPIIKNIKSNFFTMDIAKQKNGDWIIMELGDGQVSGLADNANRIDFYKSLI
ncbi:MAG: ATP-grasp domain-containing protein [Saprospiraceae bacterium]